jgi:tripartite-type tricarboxylate transporter receptor subunit TctC
MGYRRRWLPICAALLSCLAGLGASVAADTPWPSRAVRIIVAQAPGGPPDLIARLIAEPLSRALGVPVVVENRPDASGIIGVDAAARAAPDGYTLLIATLSTHALVPNVSAKLPYDPVRDFAAVANLYRSIKVLWINSSLPVRRVDDWIAYVRARPGALNFASGGVGSSNHIDMALLESATGVDMVHVPYNGPGAAISAVANGDAHAMVVSIGTGIGLAQGGRIVPLVLFGDCRSPLLPDVPTAAESGLARLDLSAWIGLMAPADVPDAVVTRVNAEIARILHSPEALAWADAQGLETIGGSPASFAATVAGDYRRWGDIIRPMHLKAE